MPQRRTTKRMAENIRRVMDEKHTNQTDFGTALGLSQSAISRRLLGRLPFTLDEVDAAATFLGVPVSELLTDPAAEPVK